MPIKTIFTVVSLVVGVAIYIPYYLNIWKNKAHPHLLSWITWGLLTGLGFVLSFSRGGGQGSWIFALESAMCFSIAVYAFKKGEKNITRSDWMVFVGALAITALYVFTKNAALSVALAASIDMLGFVPTFRKSYAKPHEEPALTYMLSLVSFAFSIGALEVYSFVTLFYPIILVISNLVFILFVLIRRKALAG